MSAFYYPFYFEASDIITITGDEFNHLKVKRQLEKSIKITNGLGLFAIAEPINIEKNSLDLKIIKVLLNFNENKFHSTLFFGLIDDKNRIEFIIEKATELGVNEIFPLICEFSQFPKFDLARNEKKAISAIKQSERSVMPKIYQPIKFKEVEFLIANYKYKYLADFDGDDVIRSSDGNVAFFVGPEGGFSSKEKEFLQMNCESVKLSNSVLRTETACISIFQKIKL